LTFEAVVPDVNKVVNFTEQAEATSVVDCAKLCYSRNCTIAGYSPTSPGSNPHCLLSFEEQTDCGQNAKVSDYNNSAVVELHCMQCGGAVVEASTEGTTIGEATATTEAVVVTESTPETGELLFERLKLFYF
jgi:hypothetical protein